MLYLNKLRVIFKLLNLNLKKNLTIFFYTKMYLLLFINYFKVQWFTLLYSISMLFVYILRLLKYYYIRIKFYIMFFINKHINFFFKKTNNFKYFFFKKTNNFKVPLILFSTITFKNLRSILNYMNLISQLFLIFVSIFLCYSTEFIFLAVWQSLNMSFLFIEFLENFTHAIFSLINLIQLDFGYFNELILFIVPEYYLNLPGYLAFKHSLLFPVVEFYTHQIMYCRTLVVAITDTWRQWAFEFTQWVYYWNLTSAIIYNPEVAVIFKSTLYVNYNEIINFSLPILVFELAPHLLFTSNFWALLDLWYLLLELSNATGWWLTLLLDIIGTLMRSPGLTVGLSIKWFMVSKVALMELFLYYAVYFSLSLIKTYIIVVEGVVYLIIVYYTWAHYLAFGVWQASLGWGLANFGLASNLILNFDLALCSFFWYFWGFLIQLLKILLGHCFYVFNYPIFAGYTLLCVICSGILSLITFLFLHTWLYLGGLVLAVFHNLISICNTVFVEIFLVAPLIYVKYIIMYFEVIFSVLFFFFNSDFFFFNCNADVLLWFGIWVYCAIWVGLIYLYLCARIVERGYWWQINCNQALFFDFFQKSKIFDLRHIDMAVAGRANFRLKYNQYVVRRPSFAARNSFSLMLRSVRELHYTWLKWSIKACVVKSVFTLFKMSNLLMNQGVGAGFKLYHNTVQFFLFTLNYSTPERIGKDKFFENTFFYFFLSIPWLIVTSTFDMLFWFNSSELWLSQMCKMSSASPKNFQASYSALDFNYRSTAVSPLSSASSILQFNDSLVETSQTIHKYLKFSLDSEIGVMRVGRKNFWETSNRNFVFQSRYSQVLQFGTFWRWAYLRAQEFERYFENQDASADDPMEIFAYDSWYASPIAISWSTNFGRSIWFAIILPMIGNFCPFFDILFFLGGRDFERQFFSDVAVVQEVNKTTNQILEFDLAELFVNHKILQIREFIDYYIYWKALGNTYLKYAEPRASFVANFFKSFEELRSFPVAYTAFVEHPYTYNVAAVRENNQRLVTINLLKFGRLKRQVTDYWLNRSELNNFIPYCAYSEPLYESLSMFNTSDICLLPRRLNVFWRRSMFTTLDFAAGSLFGNWGTTNVLYETFYSQFYYKYIAMKQNYSFAFIEYDRIQFFKKLKLTIEGPDVLNFTRDAWAKKKFHPSATQKWNLHVMLFFNKLKYLMTNTEVFFSYAPYFYWTLNNVANFLAGNQIFGWVDWFLRTLFYAVTKIYYSLTAFYAPPISYNSLISFNLKNFMFQFNALVAREASLIVPAPNAYLFVTQIGLFTFMSPWVGRITLSSF